MNKTNKTDVKANKNVGILKNRKSIFLTLYDNDCENNENAEIIMWKYFSWTEVARKLYIIHSWNDADLSSFKIAFTPNFLVHPESHRTVKYLCSLLLGHIFCFHFSILLKRKLYCFIFIVLVISAGSWNGGCGY